MLTATAENRTVTCEVSLPPFKAAGPPMGTVYHQTSACLVVDGLLSDEECDQLSAAFCDVAAATNGYNHRRKKCASVPSLSDIIAERFTQANLLPYLVYRPTATTRATNVDADADPNPHNNHSNYWNFESVCPLWRFVQCPPNEPMAPHLDATIVTSVNACSLFTVLVYLTTNPDGALSIDGESLLPVKGRVVLFDQRLVHSGEVNGAEKQFLRSELMYRRLEPLVSAVDDQAFDLYATAIAQQDPEMEQAAFDLSPALESVCLGV